MRVIAKPKKEEKILESVGKKAKPDQIKKSLVHKAECCVVHLCGCK